MGLLGRWIDSLTDEERDRIVEAQGWGFGWFGGCYGDRRCLVEQVDPGVSYRPITESEWAVVTRFDVLCDRFGLDRIVRAVKLRAGHVPDVCEPSGKDERIPGAWPVTVNPGRPRG